MNNVESEIQVPPSQDYNIIFFIIPGILGIVFFFLKRTNRIEGITNIIQIERISEIKEKILDKLSELKEKMPVIKK